MFLAYLKAGDFPGADMARKFLQMGWTRARRYANHKGGRKYDKQTGDPLPRGEDPEKAQAAAKYNPDNVDAYVMIGRAAHGKRDRKLLAEMLTKVGALAPNSEQLKALQSLR